MTDVWTKARPPSTYALDSPRAIWPAVSASPPLASIWFACPPPLGPARPPDFVARRPNARISLSI